ncbi:MAG: RlmI/RlmK family 23S rRNA methyltransferase [Planctomycetes bacterium]|nr:RlmI/RlmK family 23S rRNA methyltransferase [Planctomycetota bacterium]
MPRRPSELPTLKLSVRATGRHPVFWRKQVRRPERPIAAGSLVFVEDKLGRPVGTGFYNSRSQRALRMIDRGRRPVGEAHVMELVERAITWREQALGLPERTNAYRLVHAEGDGVPGLILDRLGDYIVAQVFCKGIESLMEGIGETLLARFPGSKLVLRVDAHARKLEGIDLTETGAVDTAELTEEGLHYGFVPGAGHKTGFFCDQRENRLAFAEFARGRKVLDLFCNSGGFGMHAARSGAKSVRAVDLDEDAVALARGNAERNQSRVDFVHGDAFEVLRGEAKDHDCIVLDPPKWIAGDKDRDHGLGRYLDANRLAFAALAPGGRLLTCSCSGSLSEDHFLAVLREAAARANRDARLLRITGAGPDHPVALECPETRYLKAAWLEVR